MMDKKQLRAKKKQFDKMRQQKSTSSSTRSTSTGTRSNNSSGKKAASNVIKKVNNSSGQRTNNSSTRPAPKKLQTQKKPIRKLSPEAQAARERRLAIESKRPKKNVRRKKNYVVYYVILAILVIVSGTILARNYLFQVEEIIVNTDQSYDKKKIIADSGILMGDNILKVNQASVEQAVLNAHTRLDSVDVKAKFPNKFEISIKVADADIIIADKEKAHYYTLSEKQRVIAVDTALPTSTKVPFVDGIIARPMAVGIFAELADDELFIKYKNLENLLDKHKYKNVTKVDVSDIYNIKVTLKRGIEIVVGNSSELDDKLKLAKKILDEEIGKKEKGQLIASTFGKCNFIPEIPKSIDPSSSSNSTSDTDESSKPEGSSSSETSSNSE